MSRIPVGPRGADSRFHRRIENLAEAARIVAVSVRFRNVENPLRALPGSRTAGKHRYPNARVDRSAGREEEQVILVRPESPQRENGGVLIRNRPEPGGIVD